jgi:hypothetical protein
VDHHKRLVIRSAPWEALKLILLSLPLTMLGILVLLMAGPSAARWFGWLAVVFFGLGIWFGLIRLCRRDTLTLTLEGFSFRNPARRKTLRWDDLDAVFVCGHGRHAMVAWTLKTRAYSKSRMAKINRATGFDFDDSIGPGWERPAGKIAELMNEWKSRSAASD